MILSVDDFLSAAYRLTVGDRKPLTPDILRDMTRFLTRREIEARLRDLQQIPEKRCVISQTYQALLTRALQALA